jgi:S-adenosyl methyltransferase
MTPGEHRRKVISYGASRSGWARYPELVERPDWAPSGIDVDQPSAARLYDYYFGGFHNFAADQEMGKKVTELWPQVPLLAQANRAFLGRSVRYLVGQGVDQFLDLGSGIPTAGNVHEITQAVAPEARVVYVDNDPVAVAHSRAILGEGPRTAVVQADVRDPESILAHPDVTRTLDLGRPVGILMVALLHFVSDEDDPHGFIARFRNAVAPGSYLVLSHGAADHGPTSEQIRRLYQETKTPITLRSRAEVEGLLEGFDLVDPGVVYLPQWRPDPGRPVEQAPALFAGLVGVGRTP